MNDHRDRAGATVVETDGKRDKRALVLEAAAEIFLDKGFDQTSMAAVAAHAGVAKQTVYAYYRDKTSLFKAVIDHCATRLDVNLDHVLADSVSTAEQKLHQVATAILKATTAPNHLALLRVLLTERARLSEMVREPHPAVMPYSVGVVASILSEDAARRGYGLADPAAHASLFVRMAAASMQFDALVTPTFHPDERLIESHSRWVTHVFLDGVRPRPGAEGPARSAPPEGYAYWWHRL
jgi:AcrR family transcriptional regulator